MQQVATPAQQLVEEDETVIAVVKRHWVGLGGIIVVSFSALVAMLVLAIVMGKDSQGISSETYSLIMVIGILIAAVMIFMVFLISYIYNQSKFTVTDKSLVEVLQRGLFNKKVARLSMSNVEDVSVDQRGMLATMLNYGTLTVQTAGEEDNFIFPLTPRPNYYAELILDARQKYAKQHPAD